VSRHVEDVLFEYPGIIPLQISLGNQFLKITAFVRPRSFVIFLNHLFLIDIYYFVRDPYFVSSLYISYIYDDIATYI
jgi:hypothetical protein